jgi:transposase
LRTCNSEANLNSVDDLQFQQIGELYPSTGQPGESPARLALITVMQFMENLTDRQAADAVRDRVSWKYVLGLELTNPGFHYSVLSEFRQRLIASSAERMLLDKLLERCAARGLLKGKENQRTDSTHVLAAHSQSYAFGTGRRGDAADAG